MPSFVVSALNASANTLTAAGVAPLQDPLYNSTPYLLTGDKVRLRQSGGALPAASPALVDGQEYWAVRVDLNTIQVCTSQANALAQPPVVVDLTGSLSGTLTIEYQLPFATPTQVALGGVSQIHAVDENATWAALVALYDMLVGRTQAIWSTIVLAITVTFNALVTFAAGATAAANQHFTVSGTGLFKHGTQTICRSVFGEAVQSGSVGPSGAIWRLSTGGVLWIRLPELPVGARILAVRLRAKDGTSSAITAILKSDVDGTQTTIASQTTGGTNTLQTITFAAVNTTIAAGTVYGITATCPSTTSDYYRVEVDSDQP